MLRYMLVSTLTLSLVLLAVAGTRVNSYPLTRQGSESSFSHSRGGFAGSYGMTGLRLPGSHGYSEGPRSVAVYDAYGNFVRDTGDPVEVFATDLNGMVIVE